jgi:dynein heavy chain
MAYLKDSFDESGQALVSNSNFLNQLKEFDKDGINDETIELL